MLRYDVRHAVRRLMREPGFTIATVLTLALGVGANIAVFAVVEAVLLRPLPYTNAEQLVVLNHHDQRTGITKDFLAIGDYVDITKRQTAFDAVVAYGTTRATVFGPEEPYAVAALYAAPGLLEALRIRPMIGRGLDADDSREGAAPVLVLGHDLWRKRFAGDSSIVGRSIKLGPVTSTIVGVAPPGFRFPVNSETDVILPMSTPLEAPAQRKAGWILAMARLKPGVTPERASSDLLSLSTQFEKEFPESNQGTRYSAVPLRDAMVGNTKTALTLLLAAVSVVLLIACVNVANLLMTRSLGRRREMAVRMALGAGRSRLALLLVTESLVLALVASAGAILFAHWGSRALVRLVPESLNVPGLTDVRINGVVLLFALLVTIVVALAFAYVSAWTLRLENGADALVTAARATMSSTARRMASGLVVVEVAFAIVLLVGAGLILRSFGSLLAVDPGFRYDSVLTLEMAVPADRYQDPGARSAFFQRAFAEIGAVPGVVAAGAAVVVPLTGNNWTVPFQRADRPDASGESPPEVGWQLASGGYFQALQIPLLSGRLFDARDRPDGRPVVIVSKEIERQYFSGETAVGRAIRLGDQTMEIVGVVGNIRRADLRDEPRADMYFPFEAAQGTNATLFLRTTVDPRSVLRAVETALRALEPNMVVFESSTLAQVADESVRVTKLVLWLLAVFAAMALVLAAVGAYGVMAYVVRQRSREIGTRMALGATRASILWLVMRSGAAIAATGTIAGLVLGLAAARALRSILFNVSESDPVTLSIAAAVLTATIMLACYVPARRAASIDPARTLTLQ